MPCLLKNAVSTDDVLPCVPGRLSRDEHHLSAGRNHHLGKPMRQAREQTIRVNVFFWHKSLAGCGAGFLVGLVCGGFGARGGRGKRVGRVNEGSNEGTNTPRETTKQLRRTADSGRKAKTALARSNS